MPGSLTSADYDRLYEYRHAASRDDLRKATRGRRTYKIKGSAGHSDPTANRAISLVMHTTKSKGY